MTQRLDLDTFTDENGVVHRVGYASFGSKTQGYLRCTFVWFLSVRTEKEFRRTRRELVDRPPKTSRA